MELTREQYNSISYYYEIFYSGSDLTKLENDFINQHKEYLDQLPKGAKICDCACGNGIQAIALKKRGFDVLAADISDEMVSLAIKNAKERNVELPIKRMSWKELSAAYPDKFDAVFCWGNSMSNSLSRQEMKENLEAIFKTLRTNGRLFIDTRNWDKLVLTRQHYYTYDIKEYKSKKYLPLYIMHIGNFDERADLEMLFLEIRDDLSTGCTGFKLDFMPFRHDDFKMRLEEAGFKILKDSYKPDEDFYYLVLEK